MIAAGFLLENLKVAINYQLDIGGKTNSFFNLPACERAKIVRNSAPYSPFDYYLSHYKIEWLNFLSEKQLGLLKWFVSLSGVLFFLLASRWLLIHLKNGRTLIPILIWATGCIFILSFGIYALGAISGRLDHFYPISRKLLGLLHSPIPVVVIYLSRKLIQ
jgi:hypothetical protein